MVLVGTECNIPPARPSRKWKYNVKMHRKVIRMGGPRLDSPGSRKTQVAGAYKHRI